MCLFFYTDDLIFYSRYTYEVAPVFILIEETIIKKLLTLAGFTEGDGIFCPGMILMLNSKLNLNFISVFLYPTTRSGKVLCETLEKNLSKIVLQGALP